ncbi:MAG: PAS domain S-box protein [Methanobacterium sp.]|jgi:PAS domain S-box-containing protein
MPRKKILIAEDEAITVMDLKSTLKILGFDVVSTASREKEVIEKIDETNPDLILMDVTLKGELDGIETVKIIKKQFDIPVIYLTAHSDEKTFERAKLTEPYGFITKPISYDGLKSTIEIGIYKHKLDKQLKEREKKFQLLYQDAPLPYQSLNESGHIIEVNQAWLDSLGYSSDEVIGKWFGDFLKTPVRKFRENFPKFKAEGEIRNIEFEMKCRDGSTIDVEFNGKISYDEKGHFKRTHCIFQDITERKKMENKLHFQADILKNVRDCIVVYDLKGKIIYWNDGAEKVYGHSKEEIIGQSVEVLYPDKNNDQLKRDIELMIELEEYNSKKECKRKDGSKVIVTIREALMHDANRGITGIISISRNITDNKTTKMLKT